MIKFICLAKVGECHAVIDQELGQFVRIADFEQKKDCKHSTAEAVSDTPFTFWCPTCGAIQPEAIGWKPEPDKWRKIKRLED